MKNPKLFFALLMLTFCSTACRKTIDTTLPSATVSYELKAINPSVTINQRNTAANFEWTSAIANTSLIKFEAKQGVNEIEFKNKSEQTINLLTAVDNLGTLTLNPGTYNEVEFKVFLVKNGNQPSLELKATYNNNGQIIPVTFTASDALEINMEKSNVVIASGMAYEALTNIDLDALTRGINQSMLAAAQVNGSIMISSSSNNNLYNIILNNLKNHHLGDFNHH